MAQTLADYITPQGDFSTTPLNPDGRRDSNANFRKLPSDLHEGAHGVLAFTLHATDPDDLRIQITVSSGSQEQMIWDMTINSNVLHTLHRLIPVGILKAGAQTDATFHLKSGDGGFAVIDNVVLWYQRFAKA